MQRLAALKVQPPVAARRGRAQGPHDSGTSSGRTTCQARLAHIASDLLRRRITGRGLRRRCRTGPRMQQASAPDGPARRLARRARAATSGRSRWSCSLVPPVPGARSDAPPNHPVACLAGPRVPGARPQAGATNVRPALRLSRFTTAQGLVDRLPPFQTPRSDPVGVLTFEKQPVPPHPRSPGRYMYKRCGGSALQRSPANRAAATIRRPPLPAEAGS